MFVGRAFSPRAAAIALHGVIHIKVLRTYLNGIFFNRQVRKERKEISYAYLYYLRPLASFAVKKTLIVNYIHYQQITVFCHW